MGAVISMQQYDRTKKRLKVPDCKRHNIILVRGHDGRDDVMRQPTPKTHVMHHKDKARLIKHADPSDDESEDKRLFVNLQDRWHAEPASWMFIISSAIAAIVMAFEKLSSFEAALSNFESGRKYTGYATLIGLTIHSAALNFNLFMSHWTRNQLYNTSDESPIPYAAVSCLFNIGEIVMQLEIALAGLFSRQVVHAARSDTNGVVLSDYPVHGRKRSRLIGGDNNEAPNDAAVGYFNDRAKTSDALINRLTLTWSFNASSFQIILQSFVFFDIINSRSNIDFWICASIASSVWSLAWSAWTAEQVILDRLGISLTIMEQVLFPIWKLCNVIARTFVVMFIVYRLRFFAIPFMLVHCIAFFYWQFYPHDYQYMLQVKLQSCYKSIFHNSYNYIISPVSYKVTRFVVFFIETTLWILISMIPAPLGYGLETLGLFSLFLLLSMVELSFILLSNKYWKTL